MRTLVAVLAVARRAGRFARSVELVRTKTGVGANVRGLPRVCIVRDTHLYVIYLTHLPTYLPG